MINKFKIISFFITILAFTYYSVDAEIMRTRKIALIPFTNLSGQMDAWNVTQSQIENLLRERGWELCDMQSVISILSEHRQRWGHTLDLAVMQELEDRLQADEALLGIISYTTSDEINPIPQWSLYARIIDFASGKTRWGGHVGHSGRDFEIVLGLGVVRDREKLLRRCLKELFKELPEANRKVDPPKIRWSKSRLKQLVESSAYIEKSLDLDDISTLVVLPFHNACDRPGAALITGAVFTSLLEWEAGIRLREESEVRKILQQSGIINTEYLTPETLSQLGNLLGVKAVIMGTVETYVEVKERNNRIVPECSFHVRLVRTTDGKILWSCQHSGHGDDGPQAFGLGYQENIAQVSYKTLHEMVGTLNRKINDY